MAKGQVLSVVQLYAVDGKLYPTFDKALAAQATLAAKGKHTLVATKQVLKVIELEFDNVMYFHIQMVPDVNIVK